MRRGAIEVLQMRRAVVGSWCAAVGTVEFDHAHAEAGGVEWRWLLCGEVVVELWLQWWWCGVMAVLMSLLLRLL